MASCFVSDPDLCVSGEQRLCDLLAGPAEIDEHSQRIRGGPLLCVLCSIRSGGGPQFHGRIEALVRTARSSHARATILVDLPVCEYRVFSFLDRSCWADSTFELRGDGVVPRGWSNRERGVLVRLLGALQACAGHL